MGDKARELARDLLKELDANRMVNTNPEIGIYDRKLSRFLTDSEIADRALVISHKSEVLHARLKLNKEFDLPVTLISTGNQYQVGTGYTLEQVKQAFYDTFHEIGEVWFDHFGSDESNRESAEDYWQDFMKHLIKGAGNEHNNTRRKREM